MSTIGKNNNIGSTHGKNINKVKCLYVRVQKLNYLKAKLEHYVNNSWKCNNVFDPHINQKKKSILKYCMNMTMNIKSMVNIKRTTMTMGMLGVPCMTLI
jgi:2C-methyl-D-erythritol 2,4-cyclodiphosphate synthase